jgi:hypothetical protein
LLHSVFKIFLPLFLQQGEDVAESLRAFGHLGDRSPMLVVFDIPEVRIHKSEETNVSKETVDKLLEDLKGGKLEFQPLKH